MGQEEGQVVLETRGCQLVREPTGNPWSSYMTAIFAAAKEADDHFLLSRWDAGINSLGDVQAAINGLVEWMVKREAMNR